MKSVKRILQKLSTGALMLAFGGLMLSACNKSDSNVVDMPAAGFMAFNLAPDKPAIGIALSGNSINPSPLNYTAFTGQYINIYPGNRSVEAYDYSSNGGFTNTNFSFEADKYYSLFVVGADSVYRNIIVEDDFDSLSASNGKAYVRFVNAIPDSSQPVVKISGNGTDFVSQPAKFAAVSGFTAVTPGSLAVTVTNGSNINANRTIELSEKKAYTVLVIGKPGETGNDKGVQIRFIQNGTLTDEPATNQ
jgi:uncharacterized protein DUF4397